MKTKVDMRSLEAQALTRRKGAPESFESEAQLVEALKKCIRRANLREWTTDLEVDAGVGIADIVLSKRNQKTTRELQRLASVPTRLAPLLAPSTSSKIRSSEEMAAALGTSSAAATRVLSMFKRIGLLRPNAKRIEIAAVEKVPFNTIIAVEAKLSDWPRALAQAYRNKQFADQSWVVLDHSYHRAALKNLSKFSQSGVGLVSIDRNSGLFVHLDPCGGETSTIKRWVAQAALAKRAVRKH
ncbi:hypothetical protein ACO2Q9_12330 [Variovorax sp. VNK109]|uniref:hypothetical protein n=1 Tax=Variovorax sp. VNK109 TaxID=3400919 RepID=UPI003C054A90